MKSALLLIAGIVLGFGIAHAVNRTEEGKRFLEGVDARIEDVRAAATEGFRARTAEVRAMAAERDAAERDAASGTGRSE